MVQSAAVLDAETNMFVGNAVPDAASPRVAVLSATFFPHSPSAAAYQFDELSEA